MQTPIRQSESQSVFGHTSRVSPQAFEDSATQGGCENRRCRLAYVPLVLHQMPLVDEVGMSIKLYLQSHNHIGKTVCLVVHRIHANTRMRFCEDYSGRSLPTTMSECLVWREEVPDLERHRRFKMIPCRACGDRYAHLENRYSMWQEFPLPREDV